MSFLRPAAKDAIRSLFSGWDRVEILTYDGLMDLVTINLTVLPAHARKLEGRRRAAATAWLSRRRNGRRN
jgi:hypothetical protein